MNPKKKSLREILQDFALNVQLDWDADASEEICQKKIDNFLSTIKTYFKAKRLSEKEIKREMLVTWGSFQHMAARIPTPKELAHAIFEAQEEKDK